MQTAVNVRFAMSTKQGFVTSTKHEDRYVFSTHRHRCHPRLHLCIGISFTYCMAGFIFKATMRPIEGYWLIIIRATWKLPVLIRSTSAYSCTPVLLLLLLTINHKILIKPIGERIYCAMKKRNLFIRGFVAPRGYFPSN